MLDADTWPQASTEVQCILCCNCSFSRTLRVHANHRLLIDLRVRIETERFELKGMNADWKPRILLLEHGKPEESDALLCADVM